MVLLHFRRVGLSLIAAMFLGIALSSVWYGGTAAWSDVLSLQTRWQIDQWRNGKGPGYSLERWEKYRSSLQAALRVRPDNAQLHEDLGYLYTLGALTLGSPASDTRAHTTQQSLLSQAVESYRIACELRPTFPYSWVHLAFAQHLQRSSMQIILPAFDKAWQYGRTEAGVRTPLAKLAFAHWENLDPSRRQKIILMVTLAPKSDQKVLRKLAKEMAVELPSA